LLQTQGIRRREAGQPISGQALTAGMAVWYARIIKPIRMRALNQVLDEFELQPAEDGTPGIWFEYERDKIEFNKIQDITNTIKEHDRRCPNRLNKLRTRYDAMHLLYGRHAVQWKGWIYWPVLFFTSIPIILINFGSFQHAGYLAYKPAFVFESLAVVGAVMIVSAHITGMVAKQWPLRISREPADRFSNIWTLVVALSLVLSGMSTILCFRYLLWPIYLEMVV
jgi:hypothetical protein